MSQPNWNKAPEGATHAHYASGLWYKVDGYDVQVWDAEDEEWMPSECRSRDVSKVLVPIPEKRKGHKHAALMALYAADAAETDRPWERWEHRIPGVEEWSPLPINPVWSYQTEYRRKPRVILINGHEVPEPVRKPLEEDQNYFFVTFAHSGRLTMKSAWDEDGYDYARLKRGVIHLTEEAAKKHAEALLSFTREDV